MKTNGVEKNSEDNHLNKIKIKVKKKTLEKKCDHKSFSTSSGFVFTYQDLFLPMYSFIHVRCDCLERDRSLHLKLPAKKQSEV